MTNTQNDQIQKMRQDGQSYSHIASTLDISENTIKSYCRRNNFLVSENKKAKEICTACKQCGKLLAQEIKGHPKKFCSEECRRLWWKANESEHDKKAYYTLSCVGCGKEFKSYANKKTNK